MRLVMNLDQLIEDSDEGDLLFAKGAGYDNLADYQKSLFDGWNLLNLKHHLPLQARQLEDEQGHVVRRYYEGVIVARWMDGMGNRVLGMSNGDEITLLYSVVDDLYVRAKDS